MNEFFIIDGNSLINRAFYATPPLVNKEGQLTNAVYAFTNILIKLIGDYNPAYIAVAFDMKAKTFRHAMYEGYKASRKGMPDELASQLPLLKELLTAMEITILEREGYEADDIIGTLSKKYSNNTVIITGDRDALQLIDDTTCVFLTKKGLSEIQKVDINNIKQEFGLTPQQVIEYKALCGDASDEIPGVNGIGDKTALSLIKNFGSIDNIYASIDKIEGKLKEKLINGKESAYLSKKLATICTDCGFDYDIEEYTYKYPFSDKVKAIFAKLEFGKLLAKEHLFENKEFLLPQKENKEADVIILENEDLAIETVKALCNQKEIAVYFSNNVNISDGVKEYQISVSGTFLPGDINFERALQIISPLLVSQSVSKTVFDLKGVYYILKPYNITINNVCDDVCIMHYLVNVKTEAYDFLKILVAEGYNAKTPAFALYDLKNRLRDKLESEGQMALYREIEFPLIDILYQMECDGFKIDTEELERLSQRYTKEINCLASKIYESAGETFNINSPKQLSTVLFDKLNLISLKKTKSGLSTDNEVLESLADRHEIIPMIIRYRFLSKVLGTYIEGIRNLISNDGIVHTIFRQAQTSTGRISSVEPNLQNIPVRDEEGREIRKMFIARSKENILISADYSQIELRLLAHFSGDEKLIAAYKNNEDIHTLTASQVFNVPADKVTPEMRRAAKAVNFGIIYGISNFGLANQLKIAPSRAKVYIEKYFETYSKVKSYMEQSVEFAKKHGYSITITGRKRYIPELKSPNFHIRSFGERAAMNMPLQGSAADVIKTVMISVFNRLKKEGLKAKLILQVHDELIIDAPADEKDKVSLILKQEMENAFELKVPLKIEINYGYNMYDAK
jgi:DNA polymerase-1